MPLKLSNTERREVLRSTGRGFVGKREDLPASCFEQGLTYWDKKR